MARLAVLMSLAMVGVIDADPTCPPANFSTISNLDLDGFISARWWIHQMMETTYLPKTQNRCVYAEYKKGDKPSFPWGYEIHVHNHAEQVAPPHKVQDSGPSLLCAKIVDGPRGKLSVAPCFLPVITSGDYWVLDYSEAEGYGVISGGPPTHSSPDGCRTGTGVNAAGLWIFTRQQKRDDALMKKIRGIVASKGFDLAVLNDVDNKECSGAGDLLIQV